MTKATHLLLCLPAFALLITSAQAGIIISEKFSGDAETDLVGTPTPDGNNWTGGLGERPKLDESAGGAAVAVAPKPSIKQDGSTGGIPFTAYHKFTLEPGEIYTLEAELSPTNKFDNQWFTVGFGVTARSGDRAPNMDGSTTYGQTVLTGSGYRFGWIGPDAKDMCELKGPGLHRGAVKVVLDTSKPKDYSIELFDGAGDSIHGPKSIGTPAITQVFIGSSGTDGAFTSFTLSDRAAAGEGEKAISSRAKRGSDTGPVVVMFGDSITDRGMATVVKKHLDEQIEPQLEGLKVINAGKGFDNATSAIERLEKDVLAHKPDIVTVSFGLNDTGGRKPEQFGESLKRIVKTLKAAGVQVILMTSTPFNNDRHFWAKGFVEEGGLDEYMDREICGRVRTLAESEGVLLCDLHAVFENEFKTDAERINQLISKDGVHITADGYGLVASHIGPMLQQGIKDNLARSGR